jgi:uncharacterized repeat protein (TIGR03803 family)
MIIDNFPKCIPLVLCAVAAAIAPAAGQTAFHVISYMDRLGQPGGISEGSPGVFYFNSGTNPSAALSITTQGTQTVLAAFPSGTNVESQLVSGANGRFYSSVESGVNPGNVFSVGTTAGSKQVYSSPSLIPSLQQNLPDGTFISVALAASGGNWYLANVSLTGSVTPIYQFPGGWRTLNAIYGSDGNYYGISEGGYLFRLTPSGALTQLVTFPNGTFSTVDPAPLLQASDGNFYGTTPTGGANGTGTIYKLTLAGQYTLLYTFPNNQTSMPTALIEASDGNLYGATLGHIPGGGYSELFRITRSGQYTTLLAMKNITAYGACYCTLVQGSDGNIYGTAVSGGPSNGGEVFALELGLPKPAPRAQHFSPAAGAVGAQVLLWGSNLLSASVQFNGVAATTVSNSGSNYVLATVPTGAATGPITITTPGGAVTTRESFTVE